MATRNQFVISLILFCFSLCPAAYAATVNAASCSNSAVQTAINSAHAGDRVVVPGGTCTWTSQVTIPNTVGIILSGGGNTTINGSTLQVNSNVIDTTEVTGFTFNGSYTNTVFAINVTGCGGLASCGGAITAPFRIDNNTFTDAPDAGTFIATGGNGPGLIDHNTFTMAGSAEMIHNLGMGPTDTTSWTDNVVPGSYLALYVETNTFTFNATGNPAYDYGTHAIESYYGARTVFRYNTLNMCEIDQHGTPGVIWTRWWEIYNNTFNTTVANADMSGFLAIRGGSGVIFNNAHSATLNLYLAGSNLQVECVNAGQQCTGGTGQAYPQLYQVGRGINQTLSPAYIYNNTDAQNGGPMEWVVEAPLLLTLNVDYYLNKAVPGTIGVCESAADVAAGCPHQITYTPYPYPYPWPPDPATGLTAAGH